MEVYLYISYESCKSNPLNMNGPTFVDYCRENGYLRHMKANEIYRSDIFAIINLNILVFPSFYSEILHIVLWWCHD